MKLKFGQWLLVAGSWLRDVIIQYAENSIVSAVFMFLPFD